MEKINLNRLILSFGLALGMLAFGACSDKALDTGNDNSTDSEEQSGGYLEDVDWDAIDVTGKTLKEVCEDKFLIGAAVQRQTVHDEPEDEWRRREQIVLKEHFSHMVSEGDMKNWATINPNPGEWNFDAADEEVAFAKNNGIKMTGHVLIWHDAPDWVWKQDNGTPVDAETLKKNMETYITTVIGHFDDTVIGWDVVNEAFDNNGKCRPSPFSQILGEDYLLWAFECASKAKNKDGHHVELYYNDFELYHTPKRQAVLRLVNKLREKGIEIIVGEQAHMWRTTPSLEAYETVLRTFSDAGVKMMITEWDMSFVDKNNDLYPNGMPVDVEEEWNQRVLDFFKLFLKYKDNITRVTTWGISDSHSWRNDGCTDYPLLFDREQKPKGAVELMMKAAVADTMLSAENDK